MSLTLEQFITRSHTDEANTVVNPVLAMTDADAAQAARDYVETKLWRIEGQVRKTQVETVVIKGLIDERLEAVIANTSNPVELIDLAKKLLKALTKLYEGEFYINLNDPDVGAMFESAKTYNLLTSTEADEITAAATHTRSPFANTTEAQVKAIRYPSSYQDVTYEGGNDKVVSTMYGRDFVEFTVASSGLIESLDVMIEMSADMGVTWIPISRTFTLTNTHGGTTGFVDALKISAMSELFRGGRWYRFKTKANDASETYTTSAAATRRNP